MERVSKGRKQKIAETAKIKTKFEKASSAVLIDYRGLGAGEDTQLRNAFRAAGVEYRVLKNALVRRALNELGINGLDEHLTGPTAVAFGSADALAPARVITKSIDETQKMSVKGGLFEGKIVSARDIKALASIPDKNVLVARLLAMLTAPVRKLAVALEQIAKKAG